MPNIQIKTGTDIKDAKNGNTFNLFMWSIIAVLFILYALLFFTSQDFSSSLIGMVGTLAVFLLACLHGIKRYGLRNLAVFLFITWIVSNAFESLSIYVGFPFGNYHYMLPGPSLFEVPLIIMPSYFAMGYMSWTLSNILTGQYGRTLKGIQVFFTPFIATFIMVMWDVVIDPSASAVEKAWIWENGGNYFGVPVSNFLGWFLVVYIFLQIFAIFISRFDTGVSENYRNNKFFWLEAAAIYGIQGLSNIEEAFLKEGNIEIYTAQALVCVFTMVFVSIVSAITILSSDKNYNI